MPKQIYDVIVIGTGAGGGMAIKTLCEAGLKVCALNAGRKLDPAVAPLEVRVRVNGDLAVVDRSRSTDELIVKRGQLVDIVREAQRTHGDPVEAILAVEPGKILYRGKVLDVERRVTEGYLRGIARFEGMDDHRGSRLEINFQNEWIVARRDDEPLAMSPDLICVLDAVSGEAVGSETIRYGQRVTVIALPPPGIFLTPKGMEHVGPRAFGYDLDYRSVFAS